MRNIRLLLIVLISLIVLAPVFGAETLAKSDGATVLDGAVGEGEYSYAASFDRGRLSLHLHWNEDVLSAGVVGETEGWVAVGFSSLKMDGALIFFGFVDGDEASFRVDRGRGHQHSETGDADILGFSLSEKDGITVLEVELSAEDFISAGADELPAILAYGTRDSHTAIHRFRTPHSVKLDSR